MTQLATEQPVASSPSLTAASLEQTLRAIEPSVVLAPLWLLQNLLAHERGTGGSPFTVPHRRILVIDQDRLRVDAADADLPLPSELPDAKTLILLARPDNEWLETTSAPEALRYYWRLLFHARVDTEVRRALAEPGNLKACVQSRVERVGRAAFNEAKFVLSREKYLPHGADDRDTYAEFAAVFLEFHYFRPDLLATYFPAVRDTVAVIRALAVDVNAADLLRQTQPPGAAEALFVPPEPEGSADATDEAAAREDLKQLAARDAVRAPQMLTRATKAAAAGNATRAAILRIRVFRAVRNPDAMQDAMQDLEGLVQRLRAALGLDDAATSAWSAALIPLLAHAAGGWWNPEGKLLYDLQKICVDHEREIYSIGIVEWLLEFCRRPLRRPQPNQRQMLILKALRSAIARLPKTRLAATQRTALDHLLHTALHDVEHRVRSTLRPAVVESLKAGGIHPHTNVERVAETKLIEELLDGLQDRGFLTMGNVRDAISRNQIKFHDLRGLVTWLRGNQLLRIDRRLADTLDGVYHRGEIYLRFFQRVSSLLFATTIGRLLTKTVIMPILGAYLILEALDHTIFLVLRLITHVKGITLSHFEEMKGKSVGEFFAENIPFVLLILVLLGVLNWPHFRAGVGHAMKLFGRILRGLFYDLPRWLILQPAVQRVLKSREFRLVGRYFLKPLAFAGIAWLVTPRATRPPVRLGLTVGVFVAVNVLLNSRTGRAIEQAALHWLRVFWTRVSGDILGNLRGIMHLFERMLEYLDRMLYAVDEWLRFRAGQSKLSLIAKATMGIAWFYIAYFIRFAINLLVEPQINPIKHFPVVTVSHKIVLPQAPAVAHGLQGLGISSVRAGTMAAGIVTVIPGVFGFLAWEFKENWKLYRANRAKALKPVPVGSHGESMARLLRPGFHSGTVPKIFAKLRRARRRAERPAYVERSRATLHHQIEHAEHVCEAVRHFVQREVAALLNQHPAWKSTPVALGDVMLAASRIGIELHCPALPGDSLLVSLEQRAGWILAGVDRAGWVAHLPAEQAALLSIVLLGLYKISGVDVVKEQIESLFGPGPVAFELSRDQLIVWPANQFVTDWVYGLTGEAPASNPADPTAPRITLGQIMLKSTAVPWTQWVHVWEGSPEIATLPKVRVLPVNGKE